MYIIKDTTEFRLPDKSAVAIGKFDGIHLGHKTLLDTIMQKKEQGLLAAVFTFDPAPAAFFGDGTALELTTREEKREAFCSMGIDVLIEFPLNAQTAATLPEHFVKEYLAEKMQAVYIAAGMDLSFGKGGAGNADMLKELSAENGYQVEIIDKVNYEGTEISSTRIRKAVEQGNMELVSALLGEPYRVNGEVVHGRRLGRQLGMPTVNLIPPSSKLLPPRGVYYSRTYINNVCYKSISNIGYKPTVSVEQVMGVETYLYDFEGELYGAECTVELLSYRRPEQKFDSVDDLRAQLDKDLNDGRSYHKI